MSDCVRGCTTRGEHVTDCLCTNDCPPHTNHCEGCFPREADVGHYCQRCADRFRDALDAIPELVTQIAQRPKIISKPTSVKGPSATTVNQPSPSPAWDLADEVINWASDWAWIIAGRPTFDPIHYNNAGLPMRNLTPAITCIRIRLTQALSDDDPQLYDEATAYHRRLVNAAGADMVRRIKTPCPRCAQRTIVIVIRGGQAECRNTYCLEMWTPLEWGHVINRHAYIDYIA
jgi:hypothetical protein